MMKHVSEFHREAEQAIHELLREYDACLAGQGTVRSENEIVDEINAIGEEFDIDVETVIGDYFQ